MNLTEKINPAHTALVVIDIQRDFVSPDGNLGRRGRDFSLINPMLEKLPATIAAAKQAGVPVLYTQQIYDRTKLTPLQQEQYDLDGKLINCDIGTNGYEYVHIEPDPAHTYVKHNYDAFSNPAFCQYLTDHNIKTLVITGVDTVYCVETAIRRGFDLGYKIVVPQDLVACSATNLDLHNATLKLVDKVFGTLTTAAELNQLWSA